MSSESSRTNPLAAFGQNEWLVDELYQKYLQDPESVDRAWWNFFADYTPDSGSGRAAPQGAATAAPASPPAATPATPPAAQPTPAPRAKAAPAAQPKQETKLPAGAEEVRLRGAAARTAANMEASLEVPTATSVRAVPAKLLVDNRIVINNHLSRGRGGKVSFTHLIGYAVIRALSSSRR